MNQTINTNRSFLMKKFATLTLLASCLSVPLAQAQYAQGQVEIRRSYSVGQNVPDRGQYVSTIQIAQAALAEIKDVNIAMSLSGAPSMRLGQMFSTVTVGTASEGSRTAVLLNREGVSNTSAFGSNLGGIYVNFDDAAAVNVFNINSSTGTYQPDGRLGVNPFGTRVAYNSSQITAPLSALNGTWNSTWSVLVADAQAGNQARFDSFSLAIQGTAASVGTIDLGAGGSVTALGNSADTIGATILSSATGANAARLTATTGQTLDLTGGISGNGDFNKTGSGVLNVGNSTGFAGKLNLQGGKTVVNQNVSSSVVVGNGATLTGSGTVAALEVASGGSFAPGQKIGQFNVAGNAIWNGGGRYDLEVRDFLGGAGSGWDFFNVTGNLDIRATSTSKFIIDIVSLLRDLTPGNADNFWAKWDNSINIATAAGGVTGFDASAFDFDLSGFSNSRDYAAWQTHSNYAPGKFSVGLSQDGKSVLLNYARAIPEPSSASLVMVGLGILALRRRKS